MSEQQVYYRTESGGIFSDRPGRPYKTVAVINPTDAGETSDLLKRVAQNWGTPGGLGPRLNKAIIDALAEYANPKPPKPEEPRGIGAVVKTAGGVVWVRIMEANCAYLRHWAKLGNVGNMADWRHWGDLDVPDEDHILSWGVEKPHGE